MAQLDGLVESGNTVIVVEHEMKVVAASDWVVDIGPGAGDEGGRVVASGPPAEVARSPESRTAPYLARALGGPAPPRGGRAPGPLSRGGSSGAGHASELADPFSGPRWTPSGAHPARPG